MRPLRAQNPFRRRGSLAVVAVLIMAGIVFFARGKARRNRQADQPFDAVSAMVEASRSGEVDAYLDCFTGPLRSRIESQAASGQQRMAFGASLREQVADLKSLVTLESETGGPDEVRLVVERVFPRFNERQRVSLRLVGESWKIEKLGPLRRFTPEVPYGAPATPPIAAGEIDIVNGAP